MDEREIELEWAREAERRLRDMLSGKVKGIPRREAEARLDASLEKELDAPGADD